MNAYASAYASAYTNAHDHAHANDRDRVHASDPEILVSKVEPAQRPSALSLHGDGDDVRP